MAPIVFSKQALRIVQASGRSLMVAALCGVWVVLALVGALLGATGLLIAALFAVLGLSLLVLYMRMNMVRQKHQKVRYREVAVRRADQVAVLSHEIRTPLALVKGAGELLAEQTPGPLNEQQVRFVATITENSDVMISLAEDLLLQARIDAGLFELRLDRFDLRKLTQGIVKDLREVNGMTVSLDCPGAPPYVWADAKLIRQAITNLINNAFAASGESANVLVRITSRDDDALLSVSDRGVGMTEEQRQKIFERFVSGRPLRDGTGLGLTITQQIIAMHGGTIHVDTIARQGTTMMFTLPIEGSEK